jgi:hypothetical protein
VITSHKPPLPQHTLGTTPIPAAVRPIERATDPDLIGRVLAGLTAVATDPPDAENPCRDCQLEEERRQPVHPGEELIRILAPADPANPGADAWNIVTLSRPRGSTVPVWRPVTAYGPMTLDKANQFLAELGVQAVGVAPRSNFPILDNLQ